MSNQSISALRADQDRFDSRKNKLLQGFIPFRDDLLKRLEQFTKEALENDLRGVKPCERKKDTHEVLEVTLALNGFNIVLVATDYVSLVEVEGPLLPAPALAAKILIYPEGNENARPYVEIVVREHEKETYMYFITCFTTEGPRFIQHEGIVAEEAGQEAAKALIRYFYGRRRFWIERPTLRAVLSGEVEKPPLGFRP